MTEDRGKDKEGDNGAGAAWGLTIAAGVIVGLELLFGLKASTPVATVTVPHRHGEEELSGQGSGMSSMIGPGPTPANWRDGANLF